MSKIREGGYVRSHSGRVYRVNEILFADAPGGNRWSGRTLDVTDVESGLLNAFTGDEVSPLSAAEAKLAAATMATTEARRAQVQS